MAHGYVYVLVNASIPGLVKIGCTTRPPLQRVAELSAASGVATPFMLAYEQEFADCEMAERDVHNEFEQRGLRLAANREFFRCSASEAVHALLALAETPQGSNVDGSDAEGAARQAARLAQGVELVAEGDRYFTGEGDCLQDGVEAVRLYRRAARLGYGVGQERLGAIFVRAAKCGRADRRRAMLHLKAGVKLGNPYCWVEMAVLFARESNERNCSKAFGHFLDAAPDRDDARFIRACRRYVSVCFDRSWDLVHAASLQPNADTVLATLLDDFDRSDATGPDRTRIAAMLRYAHAALKPAPPRPPPRLWRRWLPWPLAAA